MSKNWVEIGGYRFDSTDGTVTPHDGAAVTLRPRTASVLRVLCDRRGEVVSRDEIMAEVWPKTTVTEDSLTQCIKEVRAALGEAGHRMVRTFPKRGYMLEQSSTSIPQAAQTAKPPRRLLATILLVSAIALVAFIQPRTEVHPVRAQILVTPFEDIYKTEKWTRIGTGLASEVSASLARHDWLDVRQADRATADGNHARYVLAGTISVSAGDIRLTATLSDGNAGRILWSEVWNGTQGDVFNIQSRLLEKVEATIAASWTGVIARDRLEKAARSPQNLGAFDLYLRAIEQKHLFTEEALAQSQRYLEQALELDPEYPQAWTALAVVHLLQMESAKSIGAFEEHIVRRVEATERALELSPNDPETLIQSTFLYGREGDHKSAEAALRKAVELGKNNPDILAQAAWGGARRVPVGPDAVAWARRAIALNPSPPPWYNAALATSAFYAEDYVLADKAYSKAPPTTEILYRHAATSVMLGNDERAKELLMSAQSRLPEGLSIAELEAADGNTFPPYVVRLTDLLDRIGAN